MLNICAFIDKISLQFEAFTTCPHFFQAAVLREDVVVIQLYHAGSLIRTSPGDEFSFVFQGFEFLVL